MKASILVASAALLMSNTAQADILPTDFSGSNVNMNAVHVGQFGTITNLYETLFTIPPNQVGTGSIFGFLPSNSAITFSYTFTGLNEGNLRGNTNYSYTQSGSVFEGNASDNTSPLVPPSSSSTINGAPSAPLVWASANINVSTPTSTGTVTFRNSSSGLAQFTSIFAGLLNLSPAGIGSATYAVSAVPLPAALPMFATLLAGLFGFSRARKRKAA